ncbi:MAG TPA: NAD(P)-dependent oxidoreductase [bacterium]|jgi:GDP-L-fucose synthase|nr:NAD(P)-dependent oxidoreductase [bacterium]
MNQTNSNKIRIFITGAKGFIGRNLVEYLSQSYSNEYLLFYPYHNELELLNTEDVIQFIAGNKIDIVIHCANVGGSRKTGYDIGKTDIVTKNLKMFFNLVKNLPRIKKIIFLGTGAEYCRQHCMSLVKENYFDTYIPVEDYGFSKYVCSKYIELSDKIVNLRLFGVFGKHEDYEYKFISNAIVKNLLNLPIVINQNVYFDYLYVNDLGRIINLFIKNKVRHKFYNVTTGGTVDLLTIAGKINRLSEKPSEIIVVNPGLNTEYSGSNKRLLEEFPKIEFTSFDDALKELYDWYRSIISRIDKEKIKLDEYIKYCNTRK